MAFLAVSRILSLDLENLENRMSAAVS